MIVEWIQVILTGFGLIIAFGYLGQHAKKVRIERRYDLIHSCMVKISKHAGNNHLFYKQVSSHHYLYYVGEERPFEIVDKMIETYYELKPNQTNNDFLTFEIDAEVKLISDESIKILWDQLISDIEAVESLFEQLYKIKGDDDKCIDFIIQAPIGLLGKDHQMKLNFTRTYTALMSKLLTLYRNQENQLEFNIFDIFKPKK